jgi:hypothetical protein
VSDTLVWSSGEDGGPRVLLRDRGHHVSIVIEDGRGRYLSVSPAYAAQIASGLDAAIDRIDRHGRIARSA